MQIANKTIEIHKNFTLDFLKSIDVKNKNRSATNRNFKRNRAVNTILKRRRIRYALSAPITFAADNFYDIVNTRVVDAGNKSGVANLQKAARRGELRDRKTVVCERI